MKKFLHVGCGPKTKVQTTPVFASDEWEEVRLDIDENCNPDIIAALPDLSDIETSSYDAICSSHNIVHLFPHEDDIALLESKFEGTVTFCSALDIILVFKSVICVSASGLFLKTS